MTKKQIVSIEDLLDALGEYMGEDEIAEVRRAYEYAKLHHTGQFRRSGEPYILHPVQVAGILVDIGLDATTIIGALLHDVVEDTDITLKQLADEFGVEVAMRHGVQHFHVFRVRIVAREIVVESHVHRDDFAAEFFENLRRKRACRAIATGRDDADLALQLWAIGEIIDIGLREVRHVIV